MTKMEKIHWIIH